MHDLIASVQSPFHSAPFHEGIDRPCYSLSLHAKVTLYTRPCTNKGDTYAKGIAWTMMVKL